MLVHKRYATAQKYAGDGLILSIRGRGTDRFYITDVEGLDSAVTIEVIERDEYVRGWISVKELLEMMEGGR